MTTQAPDQAVVAAPAQPPQPPSTDLWLSQGQIDARINAIEQRYNALRSIQERLMKPDIHYGKVGNAGKPTLLKAGAEMLCTMFQFVPVLELVDKIEDWDNPQEVFLMYRFRCTLRDSVSGRVVGMGEGSCNSKEIKYRYRGGGRICPACGVAAIRRSSYVKEDGADGWYCAPKADGCGTKFHRDEHHIVSQDVTRAINPDIADQGNTLLKMGQKRAFIAAVLMGTMASEFFTQDLEDFVDTDNDNPPSSRQGGGSRRSTPQRTAAPASDPPPQQQQPNTAAPASSAPPQPVTNTRKPTEPQMKRFWAKFNANGWTRQDLTEALAHYGGYERIEDLTMTHYDQLCAWADRPPQQQPPPPQPSPGPRKLW